MKYNRIKIKDVIILKPQIKTTLFAKEFAGLVVEIKKCGERQMVWCNNNKVLTRTRNCKGYYVVLGENQPNKCEWAIDVATKREAFLFHIFGKVPSEIQ